MRDMRFILRFIKHHVVLLLYIGLMDKFFKQTY